MEAIGVAASLVTLTEIIKAAVEFQHRVHEAPSNIQQAARRVEFLAFQLQALSNIQGISQARDGFDPGYAFLLKECYNGMLVCREKLTTIASIQHGKRIRWALVGQARLKELTLDLANLELSLISVLTMLQRYGCRQSEASTC